MARVLAYLLIVAVLQGEAEPHQLPEGVLVVLLGVDSVDGLPDAAYPSALSLARLRDALVQVGIPRANIFGAQSEGGREGSSTRSMLLRIVETAQAAGKALTARRRAVVLAVSGGCIAHEGRQYLVPADGDLARPDDWIDLAGVLDRLVRSAAASHALVLHDGSIPLGGEVRTGDVLESMRAPHTSILTSGGPQERCELAHDGRISYFLVTAAQALLDGKGDVDGNGLDVAELCARTKAIAELDSRAGGRRLPLPRCRVATDSEGTSWMVAPLHVLRGGVPDWATVSEEQIEEARMHDLPVAYEGILGMRFTLVPAGKFLMGPHPSEWNSGREYQRSVVLTRPYYLQVTEVSIRQWRAFRPSDVENSSLDDELPITNVSYAEAVAFADWLSARDAEHVYSLPTEAQWERASLCGRRTRFFWGDGMEGAAEHAWLSGLGAEGARLEGPKRVGALAPSPWGHCDVIGNVSELVADTVTPPWWPGSPDPQVDPLASGGSHARTRGGSFASRPWLQARPIGGLIALDGRSRRVGLRLCANPR